jgi:hypothetical protein
MQGGVADPAPKFLGYRKGGRLARLPGHEPGGPPSHSG